MHIRGGKVKEFGSFWPDSKLKMAQLALNRISLKNFQRQAMG